MTLSSSTAIAAEVPAASLGAGFDRDLPGRAVEVAGCPVPLLPLAAIHGQLDDVPVGAVERLVLVQQGLDAVLAGRDQPQALERVSECGLIDHGLLSRRQAVDVDAEDLLGPGILADLEPRLALLRGGEHHQQAGRRAACRPALSRTGPRCEASRPAPRLSAVTAGPRRRDSGWPRYPRNPSHPGRAAIASAGHVASCSWSGHPR